MKSPRFLAALAMAAVLTTGTTAHASLVGGNASNGQMPTKQIDEHDPTTSNKPADLNASGDIRVDGEFKKTITNFPTPTQDGRYLRVSMPIQMNFTYDVDTNDMKSAEGKIINSSVFVSGSAPGAGPQKLEPQAIKMSIVDFEDQTNGISTMRTPIEFVETVDLALHTGKVQLPFEVKVESSTGKVTNHSIKTIREKINSGSVTGNTLDAIKIAAGDTLKLTIDKINGQNLGNGDLIDQQTSLTSHNLKLKFEYDGK